MTLRSLVLFLSIFSIAACSYPTQFAPDRFGERRIAFGTPIDTSINGAGPWRKDELEVLRKALHYLNAYGPSFLESSEGSSGLTLRPFDSTQSDPQHRKCGSGVARYTIGSDFAEIDVTCCDGDEELIAAAEHETGHWLGLPHICGIHEQNQSCDPRWRGEAVMNPSIAYSIESGVGTISELNDDNDIDVATIHPTALDIAAFNAVLAGRRLTSAGGSTR